jgi:MFS transporter (putative signal transducer)
MTLLLFVHEPTGSEAPRRKFSEFAGQLRLAATRRSTWYGLGFALMGGAAFESAGLLAGPFLVDRGVSQETIGVFFGLVVVLATVTGGLIGGPLSDRWGRAHSVRLFLLGFVATISVLGVLDLSPVVAPHAALLGILGVTYFFIGLFTAASYALFMDRTEAWIAGTQFSTFLSATNGCEAWTGWAGGQVAGRVSFGASFLVMCAVSLVSLPLLKRFGRERNGSQSGSS